MWLKTFRAFEECGIPIKLANTFKMKIISEMDVKTDPIDAQKIANAVRTGMVPECHVAGQQARDARDLIRYRIRMVRDRTAMINRIRSMLDAYDVAVGAAHLYSKKGITSLKGLDLARKNDMMILQSYVRRMENVTEEISGAEEEIKRQVASNEDARLLLSLTGIDSFAVLLLASEIDGISRFRRPEHLVSWAGMCPRVYQSGDREYHGRIKKAANRNVNWVVIQAASTAVRHDERMRLFYERTMERHGRCHAVVITHVANKMLRIIWKMLTAREEYDSRDTKLCKRKLDRINRALNA